MTVQTNFLSGMSFTELRVMKRKLEVQNRNYGQRLRPVPVPASIIEGFEGVIEKPVAGFRSKDYLVQVFPSTGKGEVARLSINRADIDIKAKHWRGDIPWEELQRIKNECGFASRQAVEIYPAASNEVNITNMRHLWILEVPLAFEWKNDEVQ